MADKSSGEVEFVLFALDDELWLGVGSDHTDRKAETVGVTLSKQLCAKPVGTTLWRYDEVKPHWDKLKLRSYVPGRRQAPALSGGPGHHHAVAGGADQALHRRRQAPPGTAMFCGTFAVHGDISYSGTFEMELEDPVLGRKLTHSYKIVSLPDEG